MNTTQSINLIANDNIGESNAVYIADGYLQYQEELRFQKDWKHIMSIPTDTSYAEIWDEYYSSSEWDNPVTP